MKIPIKEIAILGALGIGAYIVLKKLSGLDLAKESGQAIGGAGAGAIGGFMEGIFNIMKTGFLPEGQERVLLGREEKTPMEQLRGMETPALYHTWIKWGSPEAVEMLPEGLKPIAPEIHQMAEAELTQRKAIKTAKASVEMHGALAMRSPKLLMEAVKKFKGGL